MAQQPMRSKEELCPTNLRFPPNKSNVRIDLEETQDEPLFDISLEILMNNIIYNALTHTTKVPLIYMQQFWDTFISPPIQDELVRFIKQLGYTDSLITVSQVVVNKLHQPWRAILNSLPHLIADEARLEKLKYVAKAETRGKPTFGMLIPKAMMSLMRRGDIPTPKKKKDVVQKRSKTITAEDNVFSDHDEAMEYAKQVSIKETEKREMKRRKKHIHARVVLERQVNKEVDNGFDHLKVKLKAKEKLSHDARLLLNLRRQGKESKKKAKSKQFYKKSRGKIQEKNKGERNSDHDASDNDYEQGDESNKSASDEESDKTASDEESIESGEENVESDIDKLQARYGSTKPCQHKRTHDDQDDLDDREGEKNNKRRQKDVGGSSSKKSKDQEDSLHFERGDDAEEPRQEE
ncbi:hypothetical protein Tco_0422535 [Tanacetum coccineum]